MTFNRRIIARLDVKSNILIKGIRMEGWRKFGNPVDFATRYYEDSIDELVFLDVVASLYERNGLTDIIAEVASNVHIPITVGGGIRKLEDVAGLLKVGADKVTLNTAATNNPQIIQEISDTYGSQATVLAIECKYDSVTNSWEPLTDNGRNHTGLEAVSWAETGQRLGAGEILLTSVDQDGTKLGCDLSLFKKITASVDIPVIGSSGVGNEAHAIEALNSGISAIAIGHSFHSDTLQISSLRNEIKSNGIPVRSI